MAGPLPGGPAPAGSSARFALGVAYHGGSHPGWQTQPGGAAIQDLVERALAGVANHPVATVCAGRTDAGVHALQQVIHFDSTADRPLESWVRGGNARLPASVAVQWAHRVPHDFHARFDARSRTYRYLIRCAPRRHPLWQDRAGWVFRPIDAERMREAGAHLVGQHDFSAFRSAQCQAATPVRTLSRLSVERRGDLVVLTLVANAFLHHMVRNIVGALVYVGIGRRPPQWVGELLQGRSRALAAPTFSPAGLYLAGVDYDRALQLPSAAQSCAEPAHEGAP